MVLNAAVQMLREADELKQKILKFKSGTSMLQERSLWVTQQQLQKVYQKVLVLDLDYALDKKVEQDLWNVGFKQQIEALQAISKDKKNPLRSEGQAMLSWVLQAAAGFYLCLLHQICTTFKLDLPFRRRASLLGCVEGWGAGAGAGAGAAAGARLPPPAAARYICQHCLVHLGDLARYRQQLRVAHTFYRHALAVSAHSGQPYNQLALVSWRHGRRLGALYWHVRSLLVRAPFPPAPANLARTLAAAAAAATAATVARTPAASKDLPVLPGITNDSTKEPSTTSLVPVRFDAHNYVTELIRAIHLIHTVEDLDTASSLVSSLNSSLTALIATDSFESMTLIRMTCVLIWLVHSTTEDMSVDSSALSEGEAKAAQLSEALAASMILALLLPNYTVEEPLQCPLPALRVWLEWAAAHTGATRAAAWRSRPQLWPALAHTANQLVATLQDFDGRAYETVPLPEDEELVGFTPLETTFDKLRFVDYSTWDTYGGRVPDVSDERDDEECGVARSAMGEAGAGAGGEALERRMRALRLLRLARRLADDTGQLAYTEESSTTRFSASRPCGDQLAAALAELRRAPAARGPAGAPGGRGNGGGRGGPAGAAPDGEHDSDDEAHRRPPPPPPNIISEADFREKVREKRAGILKPQGSLERAREERALATNNDEQEVDVTEETNKTEDKKEARKPRVNIAMAAIMRKQEENNKQVKFVTPPPTPDSASDNVEASVSKDQEKAKMIQPKVMKSLANLPIGRKTGGILSLKDKSAGYPHLVNTDPEPKKSDKEEKKETKSSQGASQNSQNYQQKREHPPTSWNINVPPPAAYSDNPRMTFQKNYGIQNAGISYNPSYPPPNINNQGIRLPVVNPKEIDVRTAALQKQNSRHELFQDGHKFNHNYQVSGDKKNFLNDLPPRFANQYKYWQSAQENQFNEKLRDENFKPNSNIFNSPQQHPNWISPPQMPDNQYQQPMPWWKPDNPPPNFNTNYPTPPMNVQPNFYSSVTSNIPNPYQSIASYGQIPNQGIGQQNKPENLISSPSYLQSTIGQPQLQTLQNLVASPNFNSSLNNFGGYAPAVGYDSAMYPQFNKTSFQPQLKMPDKPPLSYQGNKDLMDMAGIGFGSNALDMQQRNLNYETLSSDMGVVNNLNQIGLLESNTVGQETAGNTYSLFSGTPDAAWGSQRSPHSLWSGPGPSPLERLLEQQKQMKPPSAPQ